MIKNLVKIMVIVTGLISFSGGAHAVVNENQIDKTQVAVDEQVAKVLKDIEKLKELEYSDEQILALLQKALVSAAENGDTTIEIEKDSKMWWYVGGAVVVVGLVVGGYYVYQWVATPQEEKQEQREAADGEVVIEFPDGVVRLRGASQERIQEVRAEAAQAWATRNRAGQNGFGQVRRIRRRMVVMPWGFGMLWEGRIS